MNYPPLIEPGFYCLQGCRTRDAVVDQLAALFSETPDLLSNLLGSEDTFAKWRDDWVRVIPAEQAALFEMVLRSTS